MKMEKKKTFLLPITGNKIYVRKIPCLLPYNGHYQNGMFKYLNSQTTVRNVGNLIDLQREKGKERMNEKKMRSANVYVW